MWSERPGSFSQSNAHVSARGESDYGLAHRILQDWGIVYRNGVREVGVAELLGGHVCGINPLVSLH